MLAIQAAVPGGCPASIGLAPISAINANKIIHPSILISLERYASAWYFVMHSF